MTIKRVVVGGGAELVATAMNLFSNTKKFSVTIADDSDEAIRTVKEKKPDLAIVDIDLPKRGGDECCKRVKQAALSPETLIILAVSPQNKKDIGRCLDARCDAILPKPLTAERLSRLVTRLLFTDTYIPPRFPVRLPVHFGIHPHELTEGSSVDLTTRGMYLETEQVVPIGTCLHVIFTLPDDGTTVECNARVAWVNNQVPRRGSLLPSGLGLEFLDIDDSEVNAIREFLYLLAGT